MHSIAVDNNSHFGIMVDQAVNPPLRLFKCDYIWNVVGQM